MDKVIKIVTDAPVNLQITATRFTTTTLTGAIIASISKPFGETTVFRTLGPVDPQLALENNTIVRGLAPAVAGTEYQIMIEAGSQDGSRLVAETFILTADGVSVTGSGSGTVSTVGSGAGTIISLTPLAGTGAGTVATVGSGSGTITAFPTLTGTGAGLVSITGNGTGALVPLGTINGSGAGIVSITSTGTGTISSPPTISGTPPDMIIGAPYSFQYTVSPPGSAVTFGETEAAFFAAHSISHNGTGLLTSASVT